MALSLVTLAIMAVSAAAGTSGVALGAKGIKNSKTADLIQEEADNILKTEQENIGKTKDYAKEGIQELGKLKLQISSENIGRFVEMFSKIKNVELKDSIGLDELQNLDLSEEQLQEMKEISLKATDLLAGGLTGVGAGTLLGWGTYGGVMALGSASTGTAIGGLTGVAATNATLAWLGGGSIATGGGGIALGLQVLGGVIAGPTLLVAGGIFGSKAKTKLNDSYSNLAEAKVIVEELRLADAELKIITRTAYHVINLLNILDSILNVGVSEMKIIINTHTNWEDYSYEEKNIVASTMKTAQLIKGIIDTPLLTEDGLLTLDIQSLNADKNLLEVSASNKVGTIEVSEELIEKVETPSHIIQPTSTENPFEDEVDIEELILGVLNAWKDRYEGTIKFYIGNENIPIKKINNARISYAGAVEDKSVIALLDAHILKNGSQGVLITTDDFYVNTFGKRLGQGKIPFKDIAYAEIDREDTNYFRVRTHDGFYVDSTNTSKFYGQGDTNVYVEILNSIATILPFTIQKNEVSESTELTAEEVVKILVRNWSQVSENTSANFYYGDNIPDKIVRNAIRTYADSEVRENVLTVIDETLFKTGKRGALITKDSIYIKNLYESSGNGRIDFKEVKKGKLIDKDTYKVINHNNESISSGNKENSFSAVGSASEYAQFFDNIGKYYNQSDESKKITGQELIKVLNNRKG